MIRPVELGIALRYLASRNRTRFISFISLISILGISIAVAVLIVVLSVMNGFEYEVRERILTVVSHAAITGLDGNMEDWGDLERISLAYPGIAATAPFVSGQGMLVSDRQVKGIELRGVDPARELATSGVGRLMEQGELQSLQPGEYRIAIGRTLAKLLDVGVGDKLILMISQGAATPAGLVPRLRRFEVSGIFYAGMYDYDRGLAFVNIADAARLFRMGDAVTGVRLTLDDAMQAPSLVREVARKFGNEFGTGVYITDWTRQHANFFRSIQLTKSMIFMILLLVIAVAAFNIVSTLVMVVRDKRAEIAILRTLGASPRSILAVFMTQGTLIGIAGVFLGAILGLLIAWNLPWLVGLIETAMGFKFLAPDVYFISDFPVRILWGDVLQIVSIALFLAFVSTIYPAWRGAATQPAEALRHE